jgi:hypothetical protein
VALPEKTEHENPGACRMLPQPCLASPRHDRPKVHLVFATQPRKLPDENEIVRRLTAGMQATLASMGARRPLFGIDGNTWAVGVGLMLQLARAGIPFTVDQNFKDRFDPNSVSLVDHPEYRR